jgi:hypothetical protein
MSNILFWNVQTTSIDVGRRQKKRKMEEKWCQASFVGLA